MFKITKTNKEIFGNDKAIDDEYRMFRLKPNETVEEMNARFERLKAKCTKEFRVCDDDDDVYFWGLSTTDDDERAFEPLDIVGVNYGCTYIEYKDADGIWEIL